MNPIVPAVLDYAASLLGAEEDPRGSNRGEVVEGFLEDVGSEAPNPWCVAYEGACRKRTAAKRGVKMVFRQSASCDELLEEARRLGILHQSPRVGDTFLVLASEHNATHGGFVWKVNADGSWESLEGNSNSVGSREGYEVCSNTRQGSRYRYVRWVDLQDAPDTYELFLSGQDIGQMPVVAGVARFPARAWGERLGFKVGWDAEARAVTFDGSSVPAQPLMMGDTAYLPIRVLAENAGLKLSVDNQNRRVDVSR